MAWLFGNYPLKIGMAIYQKQQDIQTAACHSQSSSAANSTNRPDSLQSSKLDSFNVSPSIRVEELNARDGSDLPNILDHKNQPPGISAANPEISAASLGISAANFFDFQWNEYSWISWSLFWWILPFQMLFMSFMKSHGAPSWISWTFTGPLFMEFVKPRFFSKH